ncbi:MAG: 6-phosphogluconolactonase [Bdellovibrionales bacterium]|nr:6-phosphogluconolactonase [Bdellovibrionales bacterium]
MTANGSVGTIEVLSERDFAPTVADEIVASILEVLEEKSFCSLCLSGGTSPAAVYRLLGLPPRAQEVPWDKVQIFWGDERWVPGDDPKSNYRLACETFLNQLRGKTPKIEAVPTSLSDPDIGAEEYSKRIREIGYYGSGLESPPFDVVLLGVGADGHFASVFPGDPVPDDRLCYSTGVKSDGTSRITIHPQALLAAGRVLFVVKGGEKSQVLERFFVESAMAQEHTESQLLEFPILRARQSKNTLYWFLDTEAAQLIPDYLR